MHPSPPTFIALLSLVLGRQARENLSIYETNYILLVIDIKCCFVSQYLSYRRHNRCISRLDSSSDSTRLRHS
ncbi:hypothetical protein BDQ17DRAFT_146360 [Cyathus striatus]|nr:hypothetical protein BDQ17DRAFT_146360 [Cyathus striatus]